MLRGQAAWRAVTKVTHRGKEEREPGGKLEALRLHLAAGTGHSLSSALRAVGQVASGHHKANPGQSTGPVNELSHPSSELLWAWLR